MMRTFCFLFVFFFFNACSGPFSPEIEEVLLLAGDNRGELERVLKHYARTPGDSLKLRAAEFLIVNMPGKYSEYYDAPWNDVATVSLRWTSSSDKQMVLDTYRIGDPVMREDIKYITAEYLINNIDLAFKVWQERPWGRHIPFDVFCEEILPYRVNIEPLENWREKALASFADLDTVLNKPKTTSVDACGIVNRLLPRFLIDNDFPPMNYSQLMASPRGPCDNMAALAVFSMRALGIPVTFEFTPRWAYLTSGHSWNTVRDSTGKHISFMGADSDPHQSHQGNSFTTFIKPKAYRKTFALQHNILADEADIPLLLRERDNFKDVSAEYEGCTDTVTIALKYAPETMAGYVYLAIDQEQQLYPIAWTQYAGQTARFASIGRNIIYFPVYYADDQPAMAGEPFWLDENGKMTTFSSDSPDTCVTLREIFPGDDHLEVVYSRMQHGIFEGANKPDFSDAVSLCKIDNIPTVSWYDMVLKSPEAYRFVRYKSPENAFCNVAEIVFYGDRGDRLTGTNIGTPGSYNNMGSTCDKAFDGDGATYYDAIENSGAWTGLDFHERKSIHRIRCLPRTDGNHIYEKHVYELFQRTKDGWTSCGKQTATGSGVLRYCVPSRSLFYMENHTLKRKGKTFFITPGQHVRWLP